MGDVVCIVVAVVVASHPKVGSCCDVFDKDHKHCKRIHLAHFSAKEVWSFDSNWHIVGYSLAVKTFAIGQSHCHLAFCGCWHHHGNVSWILWKKLLLLMMTTAFGGYAMDDDCHIVCNRDHKRCTMNEHGRVCDATEGFS